MDSLKFEESMSTVEIHDEVRHGEEEHWQLCFQRCTYHYDDGSDSEDGYRFIWRRPDGTLQPARGQARIPSPNELVGLLQAAARDGWFEWPAHFTPERADAKNTG